MKQEINNSRMLPMSQIDVNNGQIDGVRANPRQIKGEKFDRLKASIERNPEMLALRELLVYEHDGKYIVIGGNMRYRACKELGYTQMPCKIIPPQATAEQLNAYIILDNSGFGDWDWDALANEWDSQQLTDWGVDVPNWDDEASEDEQPSDDDDFDEEKDSIECRVKKGEIWQLGKHRLMCGDSSNKEDVKKFFISLHRDFDNIKPELFCDIIDESAENETSLVTILNHLIREKDLYEMLGMSIGMFQEDMRTEIQNRRNYSSWKANRVNRWILEVKYGEYIDFTKKSVPQYPSFSIFTNGTCASPDFIDLVKAAGINPLYVSIDGPQKIHDFNRKFHTGKCSYNEVLKNVRIFQKENISLCASAVLTSYYPKPLETS